MELIDAYDCNGRVVKTAEHRELMRELRECSQRNGDAPYAVPAVQCMLLDRAGRMYIVQRADKLENPNLYSTTFGGHIAHGENYIDAARREAYEELGIELEIVSSFDYPARRDNAVLTETAIVRFMDFNPWRRSVRRTPEGGQWVKRFRSYALVGTYEGPVRFHDGEARQCIKLTLDELIDFTHNKSGECTEDLIYWTREYQHFLR